MLILLRSLLYFVAMVVTVALYGSTIALLGGLFGVGFSDRVATHWGKINLWLQRVICGLRYEVRGMENIPKEACIFLSKHQSTWEPIGLRGILPPQQSWVLKKELMQLTHLVILSKD